MPETLFVNFFLDVEPRIGQKGKRVPLAIHLTVGAFMTRCLPRSAYILAIATALVVGAGILVQPVEAQKAAPQIDLRGYRTVDNAITAQVSKTIGGAQVANYLGVHAAAEADGKLNVGIVDAGSPAAKAGVQKGDRLVSVAGQSIRDVDTLREILQSKQASEPIAISLLRGGQTLTVSATLTPISKVLKASGPPPVAGMTVGDAKDGGLPVRDVTAKGPAETAGLKTDDILLKIDGRELNDNRAYQDLLITKNAGDALKVVYRRDGKEAIAVLTLASAGGGKGGGGFDTRIARAWKKPGYRLAIIGVEYPDQKHNPKITAADWEESMFSFGIYNNNSVTGSKVHGSMADYYKEQSFGKLKIEGKMFPFVQVKKNRMDYSTNKQGKMEMFNDACEKILARDGKDALKDYDGVFFIYAGPRAQVARGSLYWPHRSNFNFQGKSWPYFIVQEGGGKMNDISVFCHEFGHMLGLPDLYARPENPGSEGVGRWSAMANQAGAGKPQHFCAWSKEQLDWITPCVIDPTVKQKLILGAIEDSPKECFKVLAKADGSEYFLLENRRQKGFDTSLPAEGLLIWRVIGNRPILEESHGIAGPAGPGAFPASVPFPSPSNDAFTPYTIPSSRSQLGGGLPVHITNIRRLPDGRITFHIGYEYL